MVYFGKVKSLQLLRDCDIRAALVRRLQDDPDALLVHELGLCQGAARIDVAVVNSTMNGYEIKSARDTLDRLPAQAAVYSRVFDTVTIVAVEQHLGAIVEHIPPWWGIETPIPDTETIRFVVVRSATLNPAIDPTAVVQLLWRDEVLAILTKHGLASGLLASSRRKIWQELASRVPLSELRREVCRALKARKGWRADRPRRLGGDYFRPSSRSMRYRARLSPSHTAICNCPPN